MKRFINILFIFVCTASTFACQKLSDPEPGDFNLSLQSAVVKTYLEGNSVLWGKNEYVKLWYNDGKDKFAESLSSSASSNDGKETASFDFAISPAIAPSYTFGGIYPSSCIAGTPSSSIIQAVLPKIQNATSATYDPAAFIMVLKPEHRDNIPSSLTAWFKRAVALNELTIKGLKGNISSLQISSTGKKLVGSREVDLSTGTCGQLSEQVDNVTVNYSGSVSVDNFTARFTTWGFNLVEGEAMTIRVNTDSGNFEKKIVAKTGGIDFDEGMLNRISITFSETHRDVTLKDFARSMTGILDAWDSNTDSRGHIVPQSYSFVLGDKTYTRSEIYYLALKSFIHLYGGGSLTDKIMTSKTYKWADNPYFENSDNNGIFLPLNVNLDFLRNYSSRQMSYVASNSQWANYCSYNGGADASKGTPTISSVWGYCCLERSLLMFSRFFKYLLDNNISDNIATKCASMELPADLFDSQVQDHDMAFWMNRTDMYSINIKTYREKGFNNILLHEYAFKYYSKSDVKCFIAKAHSYGMKVHIWMQCFWWNDDIGWRCPVIDRVGNVPASYNQELFDEIIDRAETYLGYSICIDGFHCDYIRFPGTAESHNFPKDGITGIGSITEFSRQFNVACKTIDSRIILSAALMGETGSQSSYGQEPNQMNAYFSVFMPMAYISSYGYSDTKNVQVANWFVNRSSPSKIWHGISTYNSSNVGLSENEILHDCSNISQNSNATGIALFRYGIGSIPDLSGIWE